MQSSFSRLIVFLFIVIGIVTYLKTGADLFEKVQGSVLQIELKSIDRALQGEYLLHNKYPGDLKKFLSESMEKQTGQAGYDAYGIEYDYSLSGRGYKIVSAGKNRTFGDDDDVMLTRNNREVQVVVGNSHIKKEASSIDNLDISRDANGRPQEPVAIVRELIKLENYKAKAPHLTDIELATYLDKFIQRHRSE